MEQGRGCDFIQLLGGDGEYDVPAMESFMEKVKEYERGVSYVVASIIGPQSSGKSTLINHLFGTNFQEMNADDGRYQTTKGIWLAVRPKTDTKPCTLVMDLEGSDGSERGEDDTTFEKQSALFAIAVSDVVLINIWCHDIGREQAANKPLLKAVFQVMMRLFNPHKKTLMFVIRDQTKTSLEKLDVALKEDIQKIWNCISKPPAHKETPLSNFFNVEVVALPNYEEKVEQFKKQVTCLREELYQSRTPGVLTGDRESMIPVSEFSFSTQEIWKLVRENKDLDLPAHKIMVATVRCNEIAKKKFASFIANEDWIQLENSVQSVLVRGFGEKLSSLLDNCLSEYDEESAYFDEGVKTERQNELKEKLLQHIHLAYQTMVIHIKSKALTSFKKAFGEVLGEGKGFSIAAQDCNESCMKEFDEGCADATIKQANWDSYKIKEELQGDIDGYVDTLRITKLHDLANHYKTKLDIELSRSVNDLLKSAGDDTWAQIRQILRRETESAISVISIVALTDLCVDKQTNDKICLDLKSYAREVVEKKAEAEIENVVMRMKDRFQTLFELDSNKRPREWSSGNEDIPAIAKVAYSASLKLLSAMAAIRLDADSADNIEDTRLDDDSVHDIQGILFRALLDANKSTSLPQTWNEVPLSKTLITPANCMELWNQFKSETDYIIDNAKKASKPGKLQIIGDILQTMGVTLENSLIVAAGFMAAGIATSAVAVYPIGIVVRRTTIVFSSALVVRFFHRVTQTANHV